MNTKKSAAYDFGNPGHGLGTDINCGGFKRLMVSIPPLDNWVSNGNTNINKL